LILDGAASLLAGSSLTIGSGAGPGCCLRTAERRVAPNADNARSCTGTWHACVACRDSHCGSGRLASARNCSLAEQVLHASERLSP
jgi:hypothetical protein